MNIIIADRKQSEEQKQARAFNKQMLKAYYREECKQGAQLKTELKPDQIKKIWRAE